MQKSLIPKLIGALMEHIQCRHRNWSFTDTWSKLGKPALTPVICHLCGRKWAVTIDACGFVTYQGVFQGEVCGTALLSSPSPILRPPNIELEEVLVAVPVELGMLGGRGARSATLSVLGGLRLGEGEDKSTLPFIPGRHMYNLACM